MIGIGIDLGASQTKGAAVRVLDDGTVSLVEAVIVPSAELRTRAGELSAALARHRPWVIGRRVPLNLCVSHPDITIDRIQIPLEAEVGDTTEEEIRGLLAAGKARAPAGAKVAEDLWDFELSRLFRRASDIEALGGKRAEGLFTRVPRAVAESGIPSFKPLKPAGMESSTVASLNTLLRFGLIDPKQTIVFIDMGENLFQAVLISEGQVLKTYIAPVTNLAAAVEKSLRLEAGKAPEYIRSSDLDADDPSSAAVRDAATKALEQLQAALGADDSADLPRPEKAVLGGGLADIRGMPAFAGSMLGFPAEPVAQPPGLKTTLVPPAPFGALLGAVGAALRAAGAAPLRLMPVKQSAPPEPEKQSETSAPAAVRRYRTERPEPTTVLGKLVFRIASIPERLGWAWVAIGAAAAIGLIPAGCSVSRQSLALSELRRELTLRSPATIELERQNRLIKEYVSLTESGGMSLHPWGIVLAEVAGQVPSGAFVTRLSADRERLFMQGRMDGHPGIRMKQIVARLKRAKTMKRHGLNPPTL